MYILGQVRQDRTETMSICNKMTDSAKIERLRQGSSLVYVSLVACLWLPFLFAASTLFTLSSLLSKSRPWHSPGSFEIYAAKKLYIQLFFFFFFFLALIFKKGQSYRFTISYFSLYFSDQEFATPIRVLLGSARSSALPRVSHFHLLLLDVLD